MSKLRMAPKRKGELAELRFWTEATRRGMTVAKPYGDSARYDFIVDCDGKLSRVQVKSSRSFRDGGYEVNIRHADQAYRERDFDFLAIYLVPSADWYLIPVRRIAGRQGLRIRESRRGPYAQFKDRWDILR